MLQSCPPGHLLINTTDGSVCVLYSPLDVNAQRCVKCEKTAYIIDQLYPCLKCPKNVECPDGSTQFISKKSGGGVGEGVHRQRGQSPRGLGGWRWSARV